MKPILLFLAICCMVSCAKHSDITETEITPTPAEKKIIDAAVAFAKNRGDYNEIAGNYRVALRPMLTVRRTLNEGACTSNVFQTECCCPWEFLLSPYDVVNGSVTNYNYPKSALFAAKPGKMEGSIAANFESRPAVGDVTEIQFHNLAFTGSTTNLDGIVTIKDVAVSPRSNNVMCTANFSGNSLSIASGRINSITGNLSFTDADAWGTMDVTYADGRRIEAAIVLEMIISPWMGILQKINFTMDGIIAEIDCYNQTITIANRKFKVNLD